MKLCSLNSKNAEMLGKPIQDLSQVDRLAYPESMGGSGCSYNLSWQCAVPDLYRARGCARDRRVHDYHLAGFIPTLYEIESVAGLDLSIDPEIAQLLSHEQGCAVVASVGISAADDLHLRGSSNCPRPSRFGA